ncbi:Intracellular distribution of mitochondria [Apophysomyces sp. BC1034]|nr:Intracellular distribution of mitochondria [Apophysomyces sp. BC1015]KAG0174350.1 Intracellular distribution of mitochondria [Apophysomyces sp. BC1021]KAG0190559.1 Intracellular distribution of mitochondria [Apophysomyces sp. BC1034]
MAEKVPQQAVQEDATTNDQLVSPEEVVEETYQLTVNLPRKAGNIKIIASPREAIHDIKQSIMESPETCAHSCFYLAFNGKRLNDFSELGEVEGITTETELELVEDTYTERDVRLHINRLRDLLGGPYKPSSSAVGIDPAISFLTAVTGEIDEEIVVEGEKKMEDLFSDAPIPAHAFTKADLEARSQLSQFTPPAFQRLAPQCLKSLVLSGWNPVPHAQRLRGDLLYVAVTTLENETIHITASTKGFFVNNSSNNKYDPSPKTAPVHKKTANHSLISLLQNVSPLFATNFTKLQDFITRHHMLEVLPVNTHSPSHPWAVQPPQHVYDPLRPAEPFLNFGTDAVESLRDWNDELQSHRELPKANLQERVLRERLITKIQSEFTEAAVHGAMAVVHGSVVPLNPLEPEDSHMYVYNNIFFSKGNDGRGTFEALGADEAAHVATGKDLEGVKILNTIDADGLYTLGSVIVDYKGVRVLAQSVVPGIFRRQDENSIVYGSVDNGAQISADEKFHEAIGRDVAKSLHLAEHALVDGKDGQVQLYTSMETKGLMGADGRRYLLDLYRLNPVDIEFQEAECVEKTGEDAKPAYPHKMTLLRPELMSLYWEHKFREWVKAKSEQIKKERAQEKAVTEGDKKEAAEEKTTTDEKEVEKAEAETETEKAEEEEEDIKIDMSEFKLNFNPDVFTTAKQVSGEELKEQEQVVRDASKFLNEEIIPSLVLDFASYAISPLDGDALTKAMQRRGINMRYLGKIAQLVALSEDKRINHIQQLAIQEMVVRSSKRILRKFLFGCTLEESSLCLSHYFNCLFGNAFNAKPTPVLPEGKTKNDLEWARLTPASLKTLLQQEVLLRFRYKLDDDFLTLVKVLPTLREICLRVGVQIEARDYRFHPYTEEELAAFAAEDAAAQSQAARQKQQQAKSKKGNKKQHQAPVKEEVKQTRRYTTFIPDDIFNLMPIVKQAGTRSVFAEETFEAGKVSLSQGHRQLGLELLLESLTLHEQTYGFLHPETSKCYATLAMIYHHGEDREAALDLQRKAVIAAERTCGVDHPETIHHYLNLGLFEHAAGRTKLALRYLRHALFYWDLLFGPGHPDSATADNNAGVMLQSLRDYATSTKFFERACTTQESILGKDHVITATGYHVLARAYTLEGDFAKALNAERVAYGVFEKKLGVEDPRTKESDMWLKELTSNALITAQRAREQSKATATPIAAAAEKPSQAAKKTEVPRGELPIEQVLQYINSPNVSSRKGKKKTQSKQH